MPLNTQVDTIIIGSGISGMTSGIILSKEGENVLVLEQHGIAGGLTQTYSRKGLTFPTGVHRLGSLNPGQPMWYYFNYLGLLNRLDLVPLSSACFEKFHFPDTTYGIPMGHDAFEQQLMVDFPDQQKGIVHYFKDLKKLVSNIHLYDPSINPEKDVSLAHIGSLDAYFAAINIHGRLKSLLCANNPLYGLSSFECPVLTHFLVCDSYLNSSFRINEARTPFAKALVQSLEAQGGKIRTNSQVTAILVKDKKSYGVRLATGETLLSDKVIYSGHPSLLPFLCPKDAFRPVYRKRLQAAKSTIGMFGMAMAWEKNNCPVAENDAYIYHSWDVNAHYKQTNLLGRGLPGMVFLSALPPHETLSPGQGYKKNDLAVTALIGISHEELEKMQAYYQKSGKGTYGRIKEMLAQKIMDRITDTYPDATPRITDTYSPATFERYTFTPSGSAYGIKKTAQHFLEGMFAPATRVKSLLLTGQSVGFSGIHGSIVASVNLCCGLYGKSYLTHKILSHPGANRTGVNKRDLQ